MGKNAGEYKYNKICLYEVAASCKKKLQKSLQKQFFFIFHF